MAEAAIQHDDGDTPSSLRIAAGNRSRTMSRVSFGDVDEGPLEMPGACSDPSRGSLRVPDKVPDRVYGARPMSSPSPSSVTSPLSFGFPAGSPHMLNPAIAALARNGAGGPHRPALSVGRSAASVATALETRSGDTILESESRRVQRFNDEQQSALNTSFALIERDLAVGSIDIEAEIHFPYKGRVCTGCAIHIAALHERGWQVMSDLLELRANVAQEFTYVSYLSKPGTGQPIHLAAAAGNINVLQTLLEAGARIDAKAKYDEQDHYDPIHEAAFFHQHDSVDFLVCCRAELNARNRDGLTPLHLAAKQGAVSVVKVLLRHGANAQLRDYGNQTALSLAVDGDSYPVSKLHMLARKSMDDVLEVARRCPSAADGLMKDKSIAGDVRPGVHPLWTQGLVDVTTEGWVQLMELSPGAAEDVLDAVTAIPPVQAPNHHPLPRRARLKPGSILCYYGPYNAWGFDFEDESGRTYPEWHDHLTPGRRAQVRRPGWTTPPSRPVNFRERATQHFTGMFDSDEDEPEDLVEVRIKLVKMPNCLSNQVLLALADTHHEHIFAKLATQGMLEYLWANLVRQPYCLLLAYRCTLLVVLAVWVTSPPESELLRRVCWSLVTTISTSETIYEGWEMFGYTFVVRDPWSYFDKWKNWCDLSFIIFTQMMCWSSSDTFELNKNPGLLALVALHRWWQVLYTLRAFTMFGRRILPILRSFSSMGAMLVITLFIFFGFFHAYLALAEDEGLSSSDEGAGPAAVLLAAFRTLLVSDGEGINELIKYGGASSTGNLTTWCFLVGAVFAFCVCILNLYIAVQSEAYDIAQEHSKGIFYQERTSICLQCIMRPHWPARYAFSYPLLVVCCIGSLAATTWFLLLHVSELHPVVPSVLLVITIGLNDAILLTRPWDRPAKRGSRLGSGAASSARDNYLWLCHRADWEECDQFPAEQADLTQVQGRLGTLRVENARQADRLKASIQGLAKKMHDQSTSNWQREAALLDRFTGTLLGNVERIQRRNHSMQESINRIERDGVGGGRQFTNLAARVEKLEKTVSERLDRMDRTVADRLDAIAKHLGIPTSGLPSEPHPVAQLPLGPSLASIPATTDGTVSIGRPGHPSEPATADGALAAAETTAAAAGTSSVAAGTMAVAVGTTAVTTVQLPNDEEDSD